MLFFLLLQDTPQKKSKMEEEPPCQLSPEQCRQIAENKRAALAKLQRVVSGSGSLECTLLADIGRSWQSALEPEFTKPYFVQVLRDFVDLNNGMHSFIIRPPIVRCIMLWRRPADCLFVVSAHYLKKCIICEYVTCWVDNHVTRKKHSFSTRSLVSSLTSKTK